MGHLSNKCWSRVIAEDNLRKDAGDNKGRIMQFRTKSACYAGARHAKNEDMHLIIDEACNDKHVLAVKRNASREALQKNAK